MLEKIKSKAIELTSEAAYEGVAPKLSYDRVFWIFLIGCIIGVLIEGIFKFLGSFYWESHVVCMWGWLNPLYGAAAAGFYIGAAKMRKRSYIFKVLVMMVIATALELAAGLLLKYTIGMRAWSYDDLFLNLDGMICPLFALIWGLLAAIIMLFMPKIDKGMRFFDHKSLKIMSYVLTVFLIANFSLTVMSISRWSARHYGIQSDTQIGAFLDRIAPDEWMSNRFVEWEFLDDLNRYS